MVGKTRNGMDYESIRVCFFPRYVSDLRKFVDISDKITRLRWIKFDDGRLYVWDAYEALHTQIDQALSRRARIVGQGEFAVEDLEHETEELLTL